MKKLATLLFGIALLGAIPAQMMAQDADDKKETFAWHIIVKERDDVSFNAKAYQEALSKAFKSLGDTVEDEATADNITLYIVVGKNDEDDDNDGTPDAKDTDDYGDSFADDGESITVYDMDKDPEFAKLTGALPDEDKEDGIYISITSEDGDVDVYVTKADSFKPKAEEKKEGGNPAMERFFGHAIARKPLFAVPGQCPPFMWSCNDETDALIRQAQRAREEAEKRDKARAESEAKDKAKAEAAEAEAEAQAQANIPKGWTTVLKSGQTWAVAQKVDDRGGAVHL